MEKNKKDQKEAAYILLICSFLFSQDLTWIAIQKIVSLFDESNATTYYEAFSTFSALLFCLFSIVFSSSIKIVQDIYNKRPSLIRHMDRLSLCVYKCFLFGVCGLYYPLLGNNKINQLIEEKAAVFACEKRMYRYLVCGMILSFFVFLVILALSFIVPYKAEECARVLKFITNAVLLVFLLNEVHQIVKNGN